MNNAISWFEIPATDLARAQKFYESIFGITMVPMDLPNIKMRMFPIDDPMTGIGGATCPVRVPPALVTLWHWPTGTCRPAAI